jgi:hypothetical protein
MCASGGSGGSQERSVGAVFFGCHAYVALIVPPVTHPDWQQSHLIEIGSQD